MEDICRCGTCPCPCDACRAKVARDQRIREAERAVLSAADELEVECQCKPACWLQTELRAAVRALRELKKETP